MRAEVIRAGLPLALAVLYAVTGCAARPLSPPPPDPDPMGRKAYKIGVTDLLRIHVWKNSDLTIEVPVRSDGQISMPLLDDIHAEGLEPMELKQVITRELEEYVTAPDVTVIVMETRSKFISVIGEVPTNSRIPLTRDVRVLEAIAMVGGFNTFADKSDVRIVRRRPDGGEVEYRFDYDAYIKGKAPGTNIVLMNGDTILVPE